MRPRPLAAPRAPRCAAAGRRAGSLAEPTAPGLRGLLHQSPCEKLFSFLFPPPLSEESFQQIKEKLSMPALLAGGGVGGSYGGISVPCDFIVCVIKHPRLAPPTHATSAVWDCPPGSSARLCHPVRVGRMTGHLPKTHPPRSYGALSEVAGGSHRAKGWQLAKASASRRCRGRETQSSHQT